MLAKYGTAQDYELCRWRFLENTLFCRLAKLCSAQEMTFEL